MSDHKASDLRAKVRNDGYAMELVKMYAILKRLIQERIDELREEDDG